MKSVHIAAARCSDLRLRPAINHKLSYTPRRVAVLVITNNIETISPWIDVIKSEKNVHNTADDKSCSNLSTNNSLPYSQKRVLPKTHKQKSTNNSCVLL